MQLQIDIVSTKKWEKGGYGKIIIKNNGEDVTNWQLHIKSQNFSIEDMWALAYKDIAKKEYIIKAASWKPTIKAGETIESGFTYKAKKGGIEGDLKIDIVNATTKPCIDQCKTQTQPFKKIAEYVIV